MRDELTEPLWSPPSHALFPGKTPLEFQQVTKAPRNTSRGTSQPMKGTNAVGGAFESTDESEACLDDAGEKPSLARSGPRPPLCQPLALAAAH